MATGCPSSSPWPAACRSSDRLASYSPWLDWDDRTVIADQVRTIDTVLWQGRVKLPTDRAPGQFRLVIKEWESWLDDAAVAGSNVPEPQPRARRLVYADILEL